VARAQAPFSATFYQEKAMNRSVYTWPMLVALLAHPAFSQSDELDVRQLARLLRTLRALDTAEPSAGADACVTRIGDTRAARTEEELLAVRIYDVSDLFVVAPPYVAMLQSDLGGAAQHLFPLPTSVHRFSTTMRVPVRQRVLVAGMNQGQQADGEDSGLYLFVRASVQELRDDSDDAETDGVQ
jgi:hypothetical protein